MKNRHKRKLADQPAGADSPLDAAIENRGRSTMDSVRQAIAHNQTMLAFQPVMQARAPHGVAFYEGLIRVLDSTGRVIPARDFMPMIENTELAREIDCAALDNGLRTLFRHPDLAFEMRFPSDWETANLTQAVMAMSPAEDAIVQLTLSATAGHAAAAHLGGVDPRDR